MGERGSSNGPGGLGILLLVGFIGLALSSVAGLFDDDAARPAVRGGLIMKSERLVKRAAMRDVRRNADPSDWLVYSSCSSRSLCMAELQFLALPGEALAVDHYRVKGRRALLTGASQIQVALLADSFADCTGTYLTTENPSDLLACGAR